MILLLLSFVIKLRLLRGRERDGFMNPGSGKMVNSIQQLPGIRAVRACKEKPLPCGPFGARMTIKRGTESSIEFSFNLEINLSGLSLIFTTLQAEDLPFRWKIYFLVN